jgi:hypothetical protein
MAQHLIKIVDNPVSPIVTHDFAFAGSLADAQTKATVLMKVYRNRFGKGGYRIAVINGRTVEIGPRTTTASRGAFL